MLTGWSASVCRLARRENKETNRLGKPIPALFMLLFSLLFPQRMMTRLCPHPVITYRRIPARLPEKRREEEVVPLQLPSPFRLSGEKSLKAPRTSYGVSSYKMLKGISIATRRTELHPASAHTARNVVSGSPKVPSPSP